MDLVLLDFFLESKSLVIARVILPRPGMKPPVFAGYEMLIVGVSWFSQDMVQVIAEFYQRFL
jgi:hypothetical protein